MPRKRISFNSPEYKIVVGIMDKLIDKVGHEAVREFHNADMELRKMGFSRIPISLIHKLSLLKNIQNNSYGGKSIKEIAELEGVPLTYMYRMLKGYYKSKDEVIEEHTSQHKIKYFDK